MSTETMLFQQPTLTSGEALELRRRRDDMTQAEAAGLLGVSIGRLRKWEHDIARGAPRVRLSDLGLSEWCWLMRRRAGLRLVDVSAEIGLAAKWIHRAERGELLDVQIEALAWFWRQRGAA